MRGRQAPSHTVQTAGIGPERGGRGSTHVSRHQMTQSQFVSVGCCL